LFGSIRPFFSCRVGGAAVCFGFIGASGVAAMEIDAVAVVAIRVGGALAPAAVFMALSCALRRQRWQQLLWAIAAIQ
jgi:hypothetical protein